LSPQAGCRSRFTRFTRPVRRLDDRHPARYLALDQSRKLRLSPLRLVGISATKVEKALRSFHCPAHIDAPESLSRMAFGVPLGANNPYHAIT